MICLKKIFIVLFLFLPLKCYAISAESYVVMDYDTGRVLMSKNEKTRIHEFMQHCCYFFDRIINVAVKTCNYLGRIAINIKEKIDTCVSKS